MARIEIAPPESRILLVEGPNDKHVVWQICNRSPQTPDFYIQDSGGIEPLLESVGAELNAPGRQALGILVDANDNLTARWTAITNRLSEEGIRMPGAPADTGTVINTGNKPRVGVWLMPDNSATGELENFVEQMIPADDHVWPLAQQYIDNIPPSDRKFAAGKSLRAQIHAWLAAREDPRQMGLAIRTRDLAITNPLSQAFLRWLTRLFQ